MALVQRLQVLYERLSAIPARLGIEAYQVVRIEPLRGRIGGSYSITVPVYQAKTGDIMAYRDTGTVEISVDTLVLEVPRIIPQCDVVASVYTVAGVPCDYARIDTADDLYYRVFVNKRRNR